MLVAAQRKSSISDDRRSSQASNRNSAHTKTAPRNGELLPLQPPSRSRPATWRTLFTPSFALEWGYGLVSCFYTILARTDSRDSSSRTICTCSFDILDPSRRARFEKEKELPFSFCPFFRVYKNTHWSPFLRAHAVHLQRSFFEPTSSSSDL